ncbi:MAG: type II secretion system F family protein [Firmicutes bacterium]|nr:type II secretion system F family protein [Bacillota bacterium]
MIWLVGLYIVTAGVLVLAWKDIKARQRQKILNRRLSSYLQSRSQDADEDILQGDYYHRVMQPFWYAKRKQLVQWLTPDAARKELEKSLQASGWGISVERFIFLRLVVTAVGVLFGIVLGALAISEPLTVRWMIPTALGVVAYIFFGVHMKTLRQRRLEVIERELPEIFDLLSVSIAAGLSFDMALRRVVSQLNGPVAIEMSQALRDLQMGTSRTDALSALANRTQSPELKRFAVLVAQTDRTGAGISTALRIQGREIKERRAAEAREKAATIPVRILFPMAVFIFPAVLIVIAGPAILSVLKYLGS